MVETESVEIVRDSALAIIPLLREIVTNSDPVPYTVESLEWTKFNVFISVLAVLAGFLGAFYGYRGYYFSKLTAKNVARLPHSTQLKLCLELLKLVMTNFVRVNSIKIYYSCDKKCPSDNYISTFTLPDFTEMFKPEIFYNNENAFIKLNQIKSAMKQYNHLVEIVERHCNVGVITETDIKALALKTMQVLRVTLRFMNDAYLNDNTILQNLCDKIVNITKSRTDLIEANEDSRILFKRIYVEMAADCKYMNLDFDFNVDKELREKLFAFAGKDAQTNDILLLLAYNGLLEFQHIS